jgi:hypothetical protein
MVISLGGERRWSKARTRWWPLFNPGTRWPSCEVSSATSWQRRLGRPEKHAVLAPPRQSHVEGSRRRQWNRCAPPRLQSMSGGKRRWRRLGNLVCSLTYHVYMEEPCVGALATKANSEEAYRPTLSDVNPTLKERSVHQPAINRFD